jgi:hypothetical protein
MARTIPASHLEPDIPHFNTPPPPPPPPLFFSPQKKKEDKKRIESEIVRTKDLAYHHSLKS